MDEKVRRLLAEGDSLYTRKELSGALERYSQAIQLDATCAAAWSKRAIVLGHLGRLQDALKDVQNALSLQPNESALEFDKGALLSALGEHRQAVNAFSRSLHLCPGDIHALARRAHAYYEIGEYERSMEDAKAALERSDTDQLSARMMALSLDAMGYFHEAVSAWTRVVTQDPKSAAGYWNRAKARIGTRDLAAAMEDLNHAIRIDPNCWEAYEVRSLANRKLGDFAQAQIDEATARLMGGGASVFR